jgi:hypothetical protein
MVREPSVDDGGFFAGFLDAEGCFQIARTSDGHSWGCSVAINVRADDRPVLAEMQRISGVGRLIERPAAASSHPQAAWRVQSQLECQRVARLLELHPLRSRKRREAEIWTRAVCQRAAQRGRAPLLATAADELRSAKSYVDPHYFRSDPVTDGCRGFEAYLGGLFTGEGYLQLAANTCRMVIRLRHDDRLLLDDLARWSGLGRVYDGRAYRTSRPTSAWIIYRRNELLAAAEMLASCGLRGRKAREFAIWQVAAREFAQASVRGRSRDLITRSRHDLTRARAYGPPPPAPQPSDAAAACECCVTALQQAADVVAGPLTSTAYMAARRRADEDWPHRNTIVRAFGSWADALRAAGLSERVSARAQRVPQRAKPRSVLAHDPARRALVLAAVRRCAADLGRTPRCREFFLWRGDRRAHLPALSTTYRLSVAAGAKCWRRRGWKRLVRARARLDSPCPARARSVTVATRASSLS